jgi:hypothetical protein
MLPAIRTNGERVLERSSERVSFAQCNVVSITTETCRSKNYSLTSKRRRTQNHLDPSFDQFFDPFVLLIAWVVPKFPGVPSSLFASPTITKTVSFTMAWSTTTPKWGHYFPSYQSTWTISSFRKAESAEETQKDYRQRYEAAKNSAASYTEIARSNFSNLFSKPVKV